MLKQLVACSLVALLGAFNSVRAAGPCGVDAGWVVSSSGTGVNLSSGVVAQYSAGGVGWLRIEFILQGSHTIWDASLIALYDQAINNARAAGLQVVGLIDNTSWKGGQSAWNANNHETTSGNGDNPYVDNFVANAVTPIVQHFHDRIKVWEIWNEPSTWSTHSGTNYSGASFVYPSVYSWMLTKSWIAVRHTLNLSDCRVISGGIFGTTDLPANNPSYLSENSGAGWLTRVFQQGTNAAVNSFASALNTYGVYPVDGYGQHLYIDYNIQTSSSGISTYLNAIRAVYTGYEGAGTTKGTYMTEFGWTTLHVTQQQQSDNLAIAFNTLNVGATNSYVKCASWFNWSDSAGAGLYFGLFDTNGIAKKSYATFKTETAYQGHTGVNSSVNNTNILNYFSANGGEAVLGSPYDNGAGAFVRGWSGGGYSASVQDYNGGSHQHLGVFDSPFGTYEVNDVHGVWDYYLLGGMAAYGPPVSNESAAGSGTSQRFAKGAITWTAASGLSFIPAPAITAQPQSQTVPAGATVTLSVGVFSTNSFSCQWRFNGASIPGATATNFAITNISTANAGGYSVVASNLGGSTASAAAILSVVSPLTNAGGCILAPPGMADWWPAEGNANDLFGNFNGTPQNGFSYVTGKQGLGFHFDGTTSYVSLGAPSLAAPWTACLWVNRQAAPGVSAALMSDGTNALKLEQYNGTHQVGVSQSGVADYSFNYIAPVGTWVQLTFVNNGARMFLYTNGVLQSSIIANIPLPRGWLGAGYAGSTGQFLDFMAGSLDEIILFNRVLSGTEISAICSAGSAGLYRVPEFTGSLPLSDGRFSLNLKGQTGKSFTLQASTNLTDWVPVGTVANPTGTIQYVDLAATNASQKFYRAAQP